MNRPHLVDRVCDNAPSHCNSMESEHQRGHHNRACLVGRIRDGREIRWNRWSAAEHQAAGPRAGSHNHRRRDPQSVPEYPDLARLAGRPTDPATDPLAILETVITDMVENKLTN